MAGLALAGSVLVPPAGAAMATATRRGRSRGSRGVPETPSCGATCGTPHDRGVAARLQSLDLYLPDRRPGCGPTPIVVWVHGGGFRIGDKANQVRDKVRAFNREGWAFASVNYRLAGDPSSGSTEGRYPAQPRDLARALAFLRRHADEYHLRRDRTMLLGHSAGAFLVALLATDASLLPTVGVPNDSVRCTVPLDTGGYDIEAEIAAGGQRERMFRNAFGDDPATWDAASPIRLAAAVPPASDFLLFTRGRPARVQENLAFQRRAASRRNPRRDRASEPAHAPPGERGGRPARRHQGHAAPHDLPPSLRLRFRRAPGPS